MIFPLPFKVILLGNFEVGKSSFLERASKIAELEWRSSIFADLINGLAGSYRIRVHVDNREAEVKDASRSGRGARTSVVLDVFDPSGLEQYDAIPHSFYRHAQAVILFFDVTNRQSWLDVSKWYQKALEVLNIERHTHSPTFMIVATKSDETRRRQVTLFEARQLADALKAPLMETSAKFGTNIRACISKLATDIIAKHRPYIQVPRYIKSDKTELSLPLYLPAINDESSSSCWGSSFGQNPARNGENFATASNQLILDLLLTRTGEIAVATDSGLRRGSPGTDSEKICPWGCGTTIKNFSSNSAKHFESECTNRYITCKLGCGVRTRNQQINDHMQRFCPNRAEICPVKGCNEIVKASLLGFHQAEYKSKFVAQWQDYDIIHWVNDTVHCQARLRNGVDGNVLVKQIGTEGDIVIAFLKRILNIQIRDTDTTSENNIYACLLNSLKQIRGIEIRGNAGASGNVDKTTLAFSDEKRNDTSDSIGIKQFEEDIKIKNVNITGLQDMTHIAVQPRKASNVDTLDPTGLSHVGHSNGGMKMKSQVLLENIRAFRINKLSQVSNSGIPSNCETASTSNQRISLTEGIQGFDPSGLRKTSSGSANSTSDNQLREGLQAAITGFDRSGLRPSSTSSSRSRIRGVGEGGENVNAFSITASIAQFNRASLRKTKIMNSESETSTVQNESESGVGNHVNSASNTSFNRNINSKRPMLRQSLAEIITGFDRSSLKKVSVEETEEAARMKRRSHSKPTWATEFEKALDKRRELIHESSSDSDDFDEG